MHPSCYLIASIGTRDYEAVEYTFADRTEQTRFAPVAVARLIGLEGATALILITHEARNRYDALAAELAASGLTPEPIDIPDGRNEQEILEIFSRLQARVPEDADVVLDVTFALRHLPFVYLATLAYLVGLRGVHVDGIYYGAYELKKTDEPVPIIEITTLFQLLQWYHALASARDGDWTHVAKNLRADVGRLFRRGVGNCDLSRLQAPAEQLAQALAMGLPIEAGLRAADLRDGLAALDRSATGAVAARLALAALKEQLPSWAVDPRPRRKSGLPLTLAELSRQLRVAEWYLQHHEQEKALSLMRECLVSALLLASGKTEHWLDYGQRKPFEDHLNAVGQRAKAGVATDHERTLASLWDAIATKRNRFAHAGMSENEVTASDAEVGGLLERCRALLASGALVELQRSGQVRLLVTPVGLSAGVLYSGAILVRPDRFLIVTSREAEPRVAEALEHAGCSDTPRDVLRLDDPHLGYREIDRCLGKELDAVFATAAQVIVNVTGGTTVMQYAVERLAGRARRLGTPVRRCALIDRRLPEEQRADPFVLGEIVWLDEDEPGRPLPSSSPARNAVQEPWGA